MVIAGRPRARNFINPLVVAAAIIALGACGEGDGGYSASTCDQFAEQFGEKLNEDYLDTGFDPDRPDVDGLGRLFDLDLERFNELGDQMREELERQLNESTERQQLAKCDVQPFVELSVEQLSPRAREIAYTHSQSQDGNGLMTSFSEWETQFILLTEPVLPRITRTPDE